MEQAFSKGLKGGIDQLNDCRVRRTLGHTSDDFSCFFRSIYNLLSIGAKACNLIKFLSVKVCLTIELAMLCSCVYNHCQYK